MDKIKVQNIDGVTNVSLPKGISIKDFEDWLNNVPNNKILMFQDLPEKWSSLEQDSDEKTI